MNIIDVLVLVALAWAVYSGWRQGVIIQVCALIAIVLGAWLASRLGESVGRWMHLDASVAGVGGFVVVFVAVIITIAVAARVARRLFHFAGLALPDIVLGVAVSVAKMLLVLSVAFAAFSKINRDYAFVSRHHIDSSRTYRPIERISTHIFPFIDWVESKIPDGNGK